MASLYGLLNLPDTKNWRVTEVGEQVVFDAVNQMVERYNQDLAEMQSIFVQGDTTLHQIKYVMPGYGMMQEATELTRPGTVRAGASYTVGFGLRDFRDQIGWDDVTMAYATVEQLDMLVKTVMIRHTASVRHYIMKAIFNNASYTYVDPVHGDTTVYPLANGDSTLYPPVIGNTANATEDMYLAGNIASISDVNNPLPTLRNKIWARKSDADVLIFANPVEAAQIKALAAFVDVIDPNLVVNQGTQSSYSGPNTPGKVVGYVDESWIVEWRHMPAGYLYATDWTQDAPLMRRLDAVDLPGRGQLSLIAQQTEHPIQSSFFRDRHGFGAANRLNGAVLKVTGASYAVPAAYA
jgi:hypothetical protein